MTIRYKTITTEDGLEYNPDFQVGHLLRRAYQRHLVIFQENVKDSSLTSVQFSVLCALVSLGPLSQTELVQCTAVDQGTIRGVLKRLRARSLISFAKDDVDGRKVIVSTTRKGHSLVMDIIPRALKISDLSSADLDQSEREQLQHLLQRLIA